MFARSLSTVVTRFPHLSWTGKWRLSTYPAFVSIPASDVAAVIGRNVFKPVNQVFNDLWKRYSPQTFTGETVIDAQLAAFARCTSEEQKVLVSAAEYKASDAEDAVRAMRNATSIIESSSSIADDDKSKVLDLLTTQVSTSHGIRTENSVVEAVQAVDGLKYKRDSALYSLPLCTIDGTAYVVRGKIDRLLEYDGEVVLVEIKSRINKLFHEVREYEYIQVQTYMQMLPKHVRRAKLIEHYMEETGEMWIERDDEEWKDVIRPAILRFCVELDDKIKSKAVAREPDNRAIES
jgi:hypothetical protein